MKDPIVFQSSSLSWEPSYTGGWEEEGGFFHLLPQPERRTLVQPSRRESVAPRHRRGKSVSR